METYFEKEIKIGNFHFYTNIDLNTIVWLPTFATYKLESIAFTWLCFTIGVLYFNDAEEE
jgi:hypothetical protein